MNDMKNVFYCLIFCFWGGFSCRQTDSCLGIEGVWTDGEGQELVFMPSDSALWLTRFGSHVDTIGFVYRMICQKRPVLIEWNQFAGGPYSGKTLYGILEWLSDTSFRVRYEPGLYEQVRPVEFDDAHTMRFRKKDVLQPQR